MNIKLCRTTWPEYVDDVGAAGSSEWFWPPRSVITVGFVGSNPDLESVTMRWAGTLATITGLQFRVVPVKQAQIRVRFSSEGGGWSWIGTQCKNKPIDSATMRLGIAGQPPEEQRRVVLHEFGHALGLIHEHQNPAGGIRWNRQKVYDYYMRNGKHYTKKWVDSNVFNRYSTQVITNYTNFDPRSIMLYGVPAELTQDGRGLPWNTTLSPTDEAFLRQVYKNPRR